jgi:hypothetical protein
VPRESLVLLGWPDIRTLGQLRLGPRGPTAVRGGLVRDFPDAVDPQQRVEVNKGARRVYAIVPPEEDAGHIPRLRHRNDAALDVSISRGPPLETVSEEIFVEDPISVGEKNPRILVEGLLEFVHVAFPAVDVQMDHADDFVIIGRRGSGWRGSGCHGSHEDPPSAWGMENTKAVVPMTTAAGIPPFHSDGTWA